MIAVTGAASIFGIEVIRNLLDRGVSPDEIIAVSHDASALDSVEDVRTLGVQVRQANLTQPAGLADVFAGTTKLILVPFSGNDFFEPVTDAAFVRSQNALVAAKAAGTMWIGFLSGLGAQDVNADIFSAYKSTEDLIRASGLNFTILRSGLLAERYASPKFLLAFNDNKIFGISGDAPVSTVSLFDLAVAVGQVAVDDSHNGATLDLVGEAPSTVNDFVALLNRTPGGDTVEFVTQTEDEYRQLLTNAGSMDVEATLDLELAIKDNRLQSQSKDLRTLLGRDPLTLSDDFVNIEVLISLTLTPGGAARRFVRPQTK